MESTLISVVGSSLTTVIGWCGDVLKAVVGADGALHDLLPLWAVGISISAVMLGIKVMRGFAWGN